MLANFVIRDARDAGDIVAARRLFEAYAASLDVDLCFQNFAQELERLPGDYAPPRGCLLIAERARLPIGCVALRPLSAAPDATPASEMKRLFVQPEARGLGIGPALAKTVIERARVAQARALYTSLGFRECAPYYRNPLPGTVYMTLPL